MKNKKAVALLIVVPVLIAALVICISLAGTVKAAGYEPSTTTTAPGSAPPTATDTLPVSAVPTVSAETGVLAASTAETAPGTDSIEVYGEGKVSINPDVAYVTLGYQNNGADPQKAQDDNAAQMAKIITAVKTAGIADADIQTSQYYVAPDYNTDNQSVKGFIVTDTVSVTVRTVSKTGAIIKAAYDSGANLFYGISFDLIKRQDSYLQALDIAMGRAKEKATKLAADSGRNLGAVISVKESLVSSVPYPQYTNYAYSPALNTSVSAGSISSGQLEITAMVTVTYKLN